MEVTWRKVLNETVTAIEGGQIQPNLNEFVLTTYSGRIIGFYDSEDPNKAVEQQIQQTQSIVEKKGGKKTG